MDRRRQLGSDRRKSGPVGAHRRGEQHRSRTVSFCLIHRRVSVAEERLARTRIAGIEHDHTDRRSGRDDLTFDVDGYFDRLAEATREFHHVVAGINAFTQDDEFISAHTSDGVLGADGALDSPGHLPEDVIANPVAHRVVDRLETIDIEVHDRPRKPVATHPSNGSIETVEQQHSVRKTGERIVHRQPAEFGFDPLLTSDVG